MKQVLTKITACAFAALSGLCLVGGTALSIRPEEKEEDTDLYE